MQKNNEVIHEEKNHLLISIILLLIGVSFDIYITNILKQFFY